MTLKNTDSFKISVVNSQTIDEHTETITEAAFGTFRISGKKSYLTYRSGGSLNLIKTDGAVITLKRTGEYGSDIRYETGKHSDFLYRTPYGVIRMGLFTRFVRCSLSPDGGTIYLNYVLNTNGDKIYNDMKITIER